MLDGEAVILGVNGISDFEALQSGKHDDEVQLCAFDILVEGGDDLRKLPFHLPKTSLERLLARAPRASAQRRTLMKESPIIRGGSRY